MKKSYIMHNSYKKIILSVLALFLTLCNVGVAIAGAPPREGGKILLLNSPMHLQAISYATTSPNKKYLATVSYDKTAKLWNTGTGELIHTLRVPIDTNFPKSSDKLLAATFIGNNLVAVGGATKDVLKQRNWIYIFNVSSGALENTLGGISTKIDSLCSSPDGSRIAATQGYKGIKQWNTKDWQLISEDPHYEDELAYGCTYTDDNALLVTTISANNRLLKDLKPYKTNVRGEVKLYRPSGKLKRAASLSNVDDFWRIAIHPDNHHFVVSNSNKTHNGFSTGTIQPFDIPETFMPFIDKLKQQRIDAVNWSPDGDTLYFSILLNEKNTYATMMLDYKNLKNKPQPKIIANNRLPIVATLPIDNENLIVVTTDSFEKLNKKTEKTAYKRSTPKLRVNNTTLGFMTSTDGKSIFLGDVRRTGQKKHIFIDLHKRSVKLSDKTPVINLYPSARKIKGWKDTDKPYLNNKALASEKKSQLVYALVPFKKEINYIVGGKEKLVKFDKSGNVVWEKQTNQRVLSIAIPRDNKTILTAHADGTLKWHNAANGELLMTMFINKNTMEWIAWTPAGMYDASQNGHNLIGEHTNKKINEQPIYQTIDKLKEFHYSKKLFDKF